MDEIVRVLVLGVVQGLTEFIPVSSSGHLILVPALFKWPDQGLAFDVGLHAGTLLAVLLLGTLNNGLTLMDVSSFWQDVTRGGVLLLAVGLDQVRTRAAGG